MGVPLFRSPFELRCFFFLAVFKLVTRDLFATEILTPPPPPKGQRADFLRQTIEKVSACRGGG